MKSAQKGILFLPQDKEYRGRGDSNGRYEYSEDEQTAYCFTCEPNCGLYLTMHELKQLPLNELSYSELQNRITQLDTEFRQHLSTISFAGEKGQDAELLEHEREAVATLRDEVAGLQEEVRGLQEQVRRMQGEGREERQLWERQQQEHVSQLRTQLEEQARDMAELRSMVRAQAGNHMTELQRVMTDLEGYRHQVQEEQTKRQELTHRVEAAAAHLKGEDTLPTELWELPREDIQISQTLLGTGGWGSVVRGTFHGQAVAIKCLHRGILSPHNEGRLRREISNKCATPTSSS